LKFYHFSVLTDAGRNSGFFPCYFNCVKKSVDKQIFLHYNLKKIYYRGFLFSKHSKPQSNRKESEVILKT